MHIFAAALSGILVLAACSEGEPGANRHAAADRPPQGETAEQWHYGRPLAPSVAGAELSVSTVPARWAQGGPAFVVRVAYRHAPAGAGLMLYIARDVPQSDLRHLPSSGGGVTAVPIPIEGSGVREIRFEGPAFSAPADAPVAFPVRSGRHVFVANMLNHRRAVIGFVRRDPSDRILAEARSQPIFIQGD